MTSGHIRILAAVAIGLVALMFVLDTADDSAPVRDGERLLPGLEGQANQLTEIAISTTDGDEDIVLQRQDDRWVVATRDGYPADIGMLRELVLALAEAEIVEEKTANPDNYARLGVGDPEEGGDGSKLTLSGPDFSYAVILGETAQGDYRYARGADSAQSYLIDRSPDLPTDSSDWLVSDIVDIAAEDIRKVTISHADGETIVVEKIVEADAGSSESDEPPETGEQETGAEEKKKRPVDFTVLDVPEGRELSYATVANSIGGALANLSLDDVRPATDAEPDTTAVFETFDGPKITAAVRSDGKGDSQNEGDEETAEAVWVSFSAEPDIGGLNERTAGWEYRLPSYKNDLLVRRWEDLLKAEDEE